MASDQLIGSILDISGPNTVAQNDEDEIDWQVTSSTPDSNNDNLEYNGRWVWRSHKDIPDREEDLAWGDENREASEYLEYYVNGQSRQERSIVPSRPSSHPAVSSTVSTLIPLKMMREREHTISSDSSYTHRIRRHDRSIGKFWRCSICSREFRHHYTLMRHMPTHTNERNYHCECGKSFRQRSTLRQHRAIHSEERPHSCEVCKKTFNRVSTLISHRKTHSGNKPYKCHLCPKEFYQKGNLRNHLFTHTNERPYRCDLCYRGFNQQSNLVCHKIRAHPNENDLNLLQQPPVGLNYPNLNAVPQTIETAVSSRSARQSPFASHFLTDQSEATSTSNQNWAEDLDLPMGMVVDPIKTLHMGYAVKNNRTPFALLTPENGNPIVVKVVDAGLMGGQQILVPATPQDLCDGGRVVGVQDNAKQIRVPVVATVVPQLQGGQLMLSVQDPHSDILQKDHEPTASSTKDHSSNGCVEKIERADSFNSLSQANSFCARSMDPILGNVQGSSEIITPSNVEHQPQIQSPSRDLDLFDPVDCLSISQQMSSINFMETTSEDGEIFHKLVSDSSNIMKLEILSDSE